MKDKSKSISVEEDVTKATKSFQNFLKDFSVNKKRLEQIEDSSKKLEYIFPELKQEISSRVKDVKRNYDSLVKQQDLMEKKLEGSASVIYFQKSCKLFICKTWFAFIFLLRCQDLFGIIREIKFVDLKNFILSR